MDEIIKTMANELERSNAGFISVKIGKYTVILTDDAKGAEALSKAWNEYAELDI